MVLPLDVDSLVSSSLNMHSHNQQLLELTSAGTAIVIPAWEPTVPGIDGQQIVTDIVQGKYPMLQCLRLFLMAPTMPPSHTTSYQWFTSTLLMHY